LSIKDRPRSAPPRRLDGGPWRCRRLAGLAVVILGFGAVEVVLMIARARRTALGGPALSGYGCLYVGPVCSPGRGVRAIGWGVIVAGGFVWIGRRPPERRHPGADRDRLIIATVLAGGSSSTSCTLSPPVASRPAPAG